ncbi:MAG: dienelactone hydrolase [Porticoccaceae bacterium]|jgi:dienelactone hydrolase
MTQNNSLQWLRYIAAVLLLIFCNATCADQHQSQSAFLDKSYSNLILKDEAPKTYNLEQRPDGLFQFYLDGAPHKNSATRFLALYHPPNIALKPDGITGARAPAVVLVHGGGGTAFAEWVKRWNKAGFAAIAIAVEGQTAMIAEQSLRGRDRWMNSAFGGPRRQGIYNDYAKSTGNEWMFHAVFAAIQANNFLRSQVEIDPQHIGIAGISWGGVITATTIGYDHRFAFAIPIYGSGFLADIPNQYGDSLATNPEYGELWEPALRLKYFTKPTLWLTGRGENHFHLPAQAASYRSVGGEVSVSIKPDMGHSHKAAWNEPEPYLFASEIVTSGNLPFSSTLLSDPKNCDTQFRFSAGLSPINATLHLTSDELIRGNSSWREVSAEIINKTSESEFISVRCAPLPIDTTYWFINIDLKSNTSDTFVTSSSKLQSIRR